MIELEKTAIQRAVPFSSSCVSDVPVPFVYDADSELSALYHVLLHEPRRLLYLFNRARKQGYRLYDGAACPQTKYCGARILLVVLLEAAQLLLAVPFAILRGVLVPESNAVGMNANAAFFGFALLMFGLFNFFFFNKYYKDTSKVGQAFLHGCAAFAVCMLVVETSTHIVPFVKIELNQPGTQYLAPKLVVLLAGAAAYALLTFLAYRSSAKSFEALDL